MTAIVQDDYGSAAERVLRLEGDVARPTIADADVLVRVAAASVDRGTWHIMAGLPYPIRLAGFGLRAPKPLNPGRSVAGTVEAVGKDVTALALGDAQLRRALTPRGRLVIVGGETDGRWLGGSDRQIRALLLSALVRQKLGTFIASENAADLAALRELVDAGRLAPAIDRTYPLSETAAAIEYMRAGRARGKLVIRLGAEEHRARARA